MTTDKLFGVVGAGQMGRGIAQVAAAAGYAVTLLDASEGFAAKGRERIDAGLKRLVDKGKLEDAEREIIVSRIGVAEDYGDLAEADFLVEAATEHLPTKESIFRAADEAMAKPTAILASNTSSISLTKLAAVTKRPEQVIGMHFMNPVPRMKLVELVRALQTSDATFDATREAAERMGKTLVVSKDAPGFLVNRMLIPFLNEACFTLQEGLGTAEDIDTAGRLGLNHPMGPFELADLIGLDTVLFIAEVLHREFGDDKYRPPSILRNYVAAGWLGRKSGRGFYRYDERGRRV
ncbi:MAG: 3-hydroxybutyryl-CoA dehydrogenase [Myxococcota bacterium]